MKSNGFLWYNNEKQALQAIKERVGDHPNIIKYYKAYDTTRTIKMEELSQGWLGRTRKL
jgi:hypothetical protein